MSGKQVPKDLETQVWETLERLCRSFGEDAIGAGWYPKQGEYHRRSDFSQGRVDGCETLRKQLESFGSKPVEVLVCLWQKAWWLWDESLAYQTLLVVRQAAADFVALHGSGEDWEAKAMRATRDAMGLIIVDTNVFKQINLSSSEGLERAANEAVEETRNIRSALNSLGPPPGMDARYAERVQKGLCEIEDAAYQNHKFYTALTSAAGALTQFEGWLATAPQQGSQTSPHARQEVLDSIKAARDAFRANRGSLSDLVLERSEPWEHLLSDVQKIVESGSDTRVFVPKRVQIRYCYPFAVGTELGPDEDSRRLDELDQKMLNEAFGKLGIKVGQPQQLSATEFFTRGPGHYGGVRVALPGITFTEFSDLRGQGVNSGGQPQHCKVWLDLSEIGNHCLCIEPPPLSGPRPHLLYRAVRAGSPYTVGETVVLADAESSSSTQGGAREWDNLHLFSQDVIGALAHWYLGYLRKDRPDDGCVARAARLVAALSCKNHQAAASQDEAGQDRPIHGFERGHLHEVVVVRTDEPLALEPEDIAGVLDSLVGGKILLKSIQRGATTLEEWVRYPPVPRSNREGLLPPIEPLPELGLAGDWCAHTGETTVFGIVAAPSWQSDAYVEAAQFVSSWTPLLKLWNGRLQKAVETRIPSGHEKQRRTDKTKTTDSRAETTDTPAEITDSLRQIERRVRMHLMQIRAEDLCATQAHRRLLDRLLKMAGMNRLQSELEAQLEAAERLTDWHEEKSRRQADNRRQILLGLITVFSLFGVAAFLALANETKMEEDLGFVVIREGVWEDWAVLVLFIVFCFVLFFIFGGPEWTRRLKRRFQKDLNRAKGGAINDD